MAAVVFIAKNREKAKRKRREGIFGFIFNLKNSNQTFMKPL